MSTAVAKLYFASPPDRNSWTYNFFGAITVVYDNAGSYFLKLLDIQVIKIINLYIVLILNFKTNDMKMEN